MKKINLNIKKIGLGIIGIIIVAVFVWPYNKNTENIVNNVNNLPKKITVPVPPIYFDSPKKIEWNLIQIDGVSKAEVLTTEKAAISEGQNRKFAELMGLNYDTRQLNSNQISINQNNKHVAIYLNNGSLEYGENIESKSQVSYAVKKSVETLESNLNQLLHNIIDVNKVNFKISNVAYQQFVYPRWVSSDEASSDTVEIEANYVIDNIPLLTFSSSPIKATYSWGGKLVKLQILLPPKIISKTKIDKYISVDEMKKWPEKSFYVYKVVVNKNYELAAVQEKIGTANITSGFVGYVYDPGSNITVPYYILEGNSELETGVARVTLITPALL